jgi:hypothetical protein
MRIWFALSQRLLCLSSYSAHLIYGLAYTDDVHEKANLCVWSVGDYGGASALPEQLRLVCYFLLVMHLPFLNANAPILLCLPGSAEFLHCQPPC